MHFERKKDRVRADHCSLWQYSRGQRGSKGGGKGAEGLLPTLGALLSKMCSFFLGIFALQFWELLRGELEYRGIWTSSRGLLEQSQSCFQKMTMVASAGGPGLREE